MSRTSTLKWHEWSPGLDTGSMTLAEVLASLPASDPEDVPEIVRRYENPESPAALPGAISLRRHDCLHVIFGRGTRVQDEAWIIGATMGASSDITDDALETFRHASVYEYPKVWAFQPEQIAAFDLGVGFSQQYLRGQDLHVTPFENEPYQSCTPAELRDMLGITEAALRAAFRKEELLIPGTRESRRLDTCIKRPDSSVHQPSNGEVAAE